MVPGCADALSAKLVARDGGFEAAFFSGFGASATRLGQPDAGIISYAEMEDAGEEVICGGVVGRGLVAEKIQPDVRIIK